MQWYKNGTVAGTGAAITQIVGFTPGRVKVTNIKNGRSIEWTDDMAAASGIIRGDFYSAAAVLSSPRAAIGSTPANVANAAFDFEIAGVKYTKAAVAAGTAPTATTIPQNKYGLFGFEIGADGTIDRKDAADNATGYDTAALALAALPSASASHVLFMYVVVMRTNAAGFVGATTSFADAETTATYYNVDLKNYITVNGITSYSGTLGYGFTLGALANLNISGDTLYWEAWRG